MPGEPDADVVAALAALGKRRLVLAIHDASFPATSGGDPGRGTPYSRAARAFLRFVRGLGFDAIMLGPQGMTSRDNPSPYDATLFSRNPLNIDYSVVACDPDWGGLLDGLRWPEGGQDGPGERVRYQQAFDVQARRLRAVHAALLAGREQGTDAAAVVDRMLASFRAAHRHWLDGDALYAALAHRHGDRHHRDWPCATHRSLPLLDAQQRQVHTRALERELAHEMECHVLGQMMVHRQHEALRRELRCLGLELYADLQVGLSPCDDWQHAGLFLPEYRLGAPPSRTNPAGQPWGYRVFDPDQYRGSDGTPGPVLVFLERRIRKLLQESDGLRIDHPHGLVCPWVYRADDPDPYRAVRSGARLFASPDLADHPLLARHAIARRAQLAGGDVPRHADDWVRSLDDAQVERYGELFAVLAAALREHGGGRDDMVCEVLSTCPYPLARVMHRHGLGRFRVTQKADVHDERDVYRSENARPEDWIMVGNHDTPPVLRLAREWAATAAGHERAAYLARRLQPEGDVRELSRELLAEPHRLVEAMFADVFASPAGHVLVFFADLLGMEGIYNRPGVVHEDNWTLRVPVDYARRHVLDLRRVLALAIRARGRAFAAVHRGLLERLDRGQRGHPCAAP